MRLFIVFITVLIAGCAPIKQRAASVNGYQSECEKITKTFTEMVSCLDTKMSSNEYLSSQPAPKLYLLTAKDLSQRVSSGEIADSKARLELQRQYVEIGKSIRPRTNNTQNVIINNQPRDCNSPGAPINYMCSLQ